MSGMAARRAAKAAEAEKGATVTALPTATKAPKAEAAPKAPKAEKVAKAPKAKGERKKRVSSLVAGRQYKEWAAVVDSDGAPDRKSIFTSRGEDKVISGEANGTIPFAQLLDHLNATVNKPMFGVKMKPNVFKALILGIQDQILNLLDEGHAVRITNLATFEKVRREKRMARNPKTEQPVEVPARWAVRTKVARSAKQFLNDGK